MNSLPLFGADLGESGGLFVWLAIIGAATLAILFVMLALLKNQFKRCPSNRILVIWGRGVDTELFRPDRAMPLEAERPIAMYMGRVAVEKNIKAFLDLDLPGTKYVVGDGPALPGLKRRYPDVVFTGAKYAEELAGYLASADVFVFPSKTDTFGLVLLEAMACGVPVAAYPVPGPVDVVQQGVNGMLDNDLGRGVISALALDRTRCREAALRHSWQTATEQFVRHLQPAISGAGISSPSGRVVQ